MKQMYLPQKLFFGIKWKFILLLMAIWGIGIPSSYAQGYIENSRSIEGSSFYKMISENGNSYILSSGTARKIGPTGEIIWTSNIPSAYLRSEMVFDNGVLHILGFTADTNLPVTNGSVAGGGGYDILYSKVDANTGSILHNGYLGGSGQEYTGLGLAVENGFVHITYTTTSPDIPFTKGTGFTSGFDNIITKLDASANVIYTTYTGRTNTVSTNTSITSFAVENGCAYLATPVASNNAFATTNGSVVNGTYDFGIVKLDAAGNRELSFVFGGSAAETYPAILVKNGEIFCAGMTQSTNFPVTDGSFLRGTGINPNATLVKFSDKGNIVYSGYKMGATNAIARSSPSIALVDGYLYFGGQTSSPALFTRTDGSTGHDFLYKINPSNGAVLFARSIFGVGAAYANQPVYSIVSENGSLYILGLSATLTGAQSTDGSVNRGSGFYIVKLSTSTDQVQFATFLPASGQAGTPLGGDISVSGGKIFVAGGSSASANVLISRPELGTTGNIMWTEYNFCPSFPVTNTIAPVTQTICKEGSTQPFTGNKAVFSSDDFPVLYYNGTPEKQNEIKLRYQWQVADNAGGPWVNVGGVGTQRDFSPPTGSVDKYYRRQVLAPVGCTPELINVSDVAAILVSVDNAPVITAGIFNTCAGTPVDISATVTGGTAPYNYSWDNGIASITNTATVTPATNGVYTLTVTDNNGCKQLGQAIVNAYAADAGPATASVCAGAPVRIGTPPPAGLAGVVYSWTPTTGLSDPNIAQPLALPLVTGTVYTLTMTVPITGGGTCSTSDNITVNLVAAPGNAGFAGTDKVICKGSTVSLGAALQAGFTYTWVPGAYLSSTTLPNPTFNAGSEFPVPNAFTYTVTANNGGCVFTDQVTVSAIQANAGPDYCGPRTVGADDPTPNIAGKTFLWEVVSGPGTITGADNTPKTTVSASSGGATVYRLTVTYNGSSCIDLVTVDECSGGGSGCPNPEIEVIADHSCPGAAFGSVTLSALPAYLPLSQWSYNWSSSTGTGISSNSGTEITLTNNVEQNVTLTIRNIDNPGLSCSKTIHVNDPSWALPVFPAPDQSICPGTSVSIGLAAIPGYSYEWEELLGVPRTSSNPVVTPQTTTGYNVKVKDNASGCTTNKIVTVELKPLVNDPGSDWIVCNNTMVTLGSPALPGYTYSWTPAVASYQLGTDNFSAEPKILIATSQDFTLTATDTQTGCTKDSTIHIVVDANPNLPAIADTTICKGAPGVKIGNEGKPGVTYSWSPSTGLSSDDVAQPIATPAATTMYTVTAQFYDAVGGPTCTKTGTVTVHVNDPQITMADDVVCPSAPAYDLSTGVSVSGATIFKWSPTVLVNNSATLNATLKANPTAPATYTLIASDSHGCADTATRTITPSMDAPTVGNNGVICVGSSIALGASTNNPASTWSVTPALTGNPVIPAGSTAVFTPVAGDANKTFTFTISQVSGGCTSTSSATVLVKQLTLPAIPTQTICKDAGTIIGVTSQPNINYQWTPETGLSNPFSATTQVSNVSGNIVYTLTATDINGCSATSLAAIGVNPTSGPSVSIPDVTVAVGGEGKPFAPQITPGVGNYQYSWSPAATVDNPYIATATATPVSIGTTSYTLSLVDDIGCSSTAQARLIVESSLVLPIKLVSFTAKAKDCDVLINWNVESADYFSRFEIERSVNGTRFERLATIYYNAARKQYSFVDNSPGNGSWKYRLKQLDIDGSFTYSAILTTRVNCGDRESLSVYPNPVNHQLYIKSSKPVKSIVLLSLTGKLILRQDYQQIQPAVISLQLPTFIANGVYLVEVLATDGTVQNSKVIKE